MLWAASAGLAIKHVAHAGSHMTRSTTHGYVANSTPTSADSHRWALGCQVLARYGVDTESKESMLIIVPEARERFGVCPHRFENMSEWAICPHRRFCYFPKLGESTLCVTYWIVMGRLPLNCAKITTW